MAEQESFEVELTDGAREALKNWLEMFDKNGDGKLNADELQDYLEDIHIYLNPYNVKELVKYFDRNGDGKLSIDELVEELDVLNQHCIHGDDLIHAFRVFDTNRDGTLSFHEMLAILTAGKGKYKWDKELAIVYLTQLERDYDKNKDGRFTYSEFVDAFQRDKFCFKEEDKPKIQKAKITERYKMHKTPEPTHHHSASKK